MTETNNPLSNPFNFLMHVKVDAFEFIFLHIEWERERVQFLSEHSNHYSRLSRLKSTLVHVCNV